MPRGSIKRLDHLGLEKATYDCLLELDLDKEYVKNDFYAQVAVQYGKVTGHIIAQNGEYAITRVNQTVSRVLKKEGWKTVVKSIPLPGLLTPSGKRVHKDVRYMRWGK